MSELLLKEDGRGKNKLCKIQGVPKKYQSVFQDIYSTLSCARSKSKGSFENYMKIAFQ